MAGSSGNIVQMFWRRCTDTPDGLAVVHSVAGKWERISWHQLGETVRNVACGLIALGLEEGERAAILSRSRANWFVADLAILAAGGCCVPIHADSSEEDILAMLRDSRPRHMFLQDERLAERLGGVLEKAGLETTIIMSGPPLEKHQMSWDQLLTKGRTFNAEFPEAIERRAAALKDDSPASIVYTAGTTGQNKGVVLSHRNFCFEMQALDEVMRGVIGEQDLHLLCLPLSHILARVITLASVLIGYATAFSTKLANLDRELREVRPTFVTVVPGILEKIHAEMESKLEERGLLVRQIVSWARKIGQRVAKNRIQFRPNNPIMTLQHIAAENFILKKFVKEGLGGRLKFFVSGGAPLSVDIAEWLESLGVLVLEGYGLTENTGAANVNRPDRYRFGSVGPPLPGVEQRIAQDGEILIRGPNVMQGYWNRPDDTASVVDDDGWLHTGDLGHFDDEGFLYVTGRKKDIIVTSGGKNVSPQSIEKLMRTSPYIEQIMICGDGRKYLTALVSLNHEAVQRYAEDNHIAFDHIQELLVHPEVRRLVANEIEQRNRRLAGYQTIRRFTILPEPLSLDAGEITPTMKLRRQAVEERYRDLIDAMYEEGGDCPDQVFLGES